jgi:hypothetical protein
MIKQNVKTINCDVLCFKYPFKFFIRLKLYGVKALHTMHCFSLYHSFTNSSYVLAARNAVFFAPVSSGIQFIFIYRFYQRRSSCLFCILIIWFIVCPPVLSELWTTEDCPGVKGSAARYSSVSTTTEGIIESVGQQQFVLESALLNVILKSVGLVFPVLVSVGQLGAVLMSLGPAGHYSSVSRTAGRVSDVSSTAAR